MYVFVKYIILTIGLFAACYGIFKQEIASAIVSVGAFISFALIEIQDLKTLNEDEE